MKYLLIFLMIGTLQAHEVATCKDYESFMPDSKVRAVFDYCEMKLKPRIVRLPKEKTVSETVRSFLESCIKGRNPSPYVCVKQALKLKEGLAK